MKIFFIFFLLLISDAFAAEKLYDPAILREGDIIFQESLSDQSKAIKLATKSRYTHVAIIFRVNDEWVVMEAVQPVRYTGLNNFIRRGINRHFVIKRLRNQEEVLTPDIIDKMKHFGNTLLGRNYDIYFGWDDTRIYCSELVWKMYKQVTGVEVGKLDRLKNFDLSHAYVKKLMKRRYGNRIPYEEFVISPEAMFESENLEMVISAH